MSKKPLLKTHEEIEEEKSDGSKALNSLKSLAKIIQQEKMRRAEQNVGLKTLGNDTTTFSDVFESILS